VKNKEDIEVRKVLSGIKRNLDKKGWGCMINGCDQKAINSHLLQRHGVLSNVVENGHCYELREKDIFSWTKKTPPFEFKRCGIQDAFSLHLFCNHHDTDVFKPIESGTVDYDNYRNQLLLSYRAICAEMRRKEIIVEMYKRYLGSKILQAYRNDYLDLIKEAIKGNEAGIKDLVFYKHQVEEELAFPADNFFFVHHTYPIKGLYASSAFTISNYEESIDTSEAIPNCIGHLIPNGECSELIFGYQKGHVNKAIIEFVNGWANLDTDSLGERLTGWFTLIESWGISPSLFERIKPSDIDHYFGLFENDFDGADQTPNVGYNMFAGLLNPTYQ